MKKRTPFRGSHPAHRVLSVRGVVALSLASLALLAGAAFYARTLLLSPQMAAVITSVLVDLTNDDRKDEGLGTLMMNPTLVAAAQAKADDMAENGYFAHNSPDGKTSWYWFREAGYAYVHAGENLAVNFSDSEDVEDAWMDSPTHRANILNGKFTEIGIATAEGMYKGKKATFVVQMFGTPARAAAAPAPVAQVVPEDPNVIAVATTDEGSAVTVLGSGTDAPASALEDAPVAAYAEAPGVPAAPALESAPDYAPWWEHVIASPKSVLRVVYMVCALALLLALLAVTRLEFRKHHLRHMGMAAAALFIMVGLFTLADRYVFAEPVIADTGDV